MMGPKGYLSASDWPLMIVSMFHYLKKKRILYPNWKIKNSKTSVIANPLVVPWHALYVQSDWKNKGLIAEWEVLIFKW